MQQSHMRAGLSMAPGVSWAYRMLASYSTNAGRVDDARTALDVFLTHCPGMTITKMREHAPGDIRNATRLRQRIAQGRYPRKLAELGNAPMLLFQLIHNCNASAKVQFAARHWYIAAFCKACLGHHHRYWRRVAARFADRQDRPQRNASGLCI